MKLRNLNGAIRTAGAKILIRSTAPDGRIITFAVSRSDAVKALGEAYPEGGMHETGLMVAEDASLVLEGTPVAPPADDEDLIPNATTVAALDANERGDVTRVENVDQLFVDLNDDEDLLGGDVSQIPAEDDDVEDLLA